MAVDLTDVRAFIPHIRRALDPGVASGSAASEYSDDMLKDIAADAIGSLIVTAGPTVFPFTLSVSNASAATTTYDWEYTIDPEMPIEVMSLVAIEAAISQMFIELSNFKTQERIADEGSSWEYQRSATLFKERIRALQDRRQQYLDRLAIDNPDLINDAFINLLYERDQSRASSIEPFYDVGQSGAV